MNGLRLVVVLLLLGVQAATLAEGLDLTEVKCRCTHGPGAPCNCVHHAEVADQNLPPCHRARAKAQSTSGMQQTCCGAVRSHGPAVLTWLTLPEPAQPRVERVASADFAEVPKLSSALPARPSKPPPRAGLLSQT